MAWSAAVEIVKLKPGIQSSASFAWVVAGPDVLGFLRWKSGIENFVGSARVAAEPAVSWTPRLRTATENFVGLFANLVSVVSAPDFWLENPVVKFGEG